jgi:hypothetical protein
MTNLFILLLLPFLCQADDIACKNVKEGIFKLESLDGGIHTITRTKNKQIENVGKTGLISEFDLKWITECSYILYNRRVIKGTDEWPAEINADTLFNEIVEISGDKHKVVSIMKKFDMKVEATLIKLEQTESSFIDNFKTSKWKSLSNFNDSTILKLDNLTLIKWNPSIDSMKHKPTLWIYNDKLKIKYYENVSVITEDNITKTNASFNTMDCNYSFDVKKNELRITLDNKGQSTLTYKVSEKTNDECILTRKK